MNKGIAGVLKSPSWVTKDSRIHFYEIPVIYPKPGEIAAKSFFVRSKNRDCNCDALKRLIKENGLRKIDVVFDDNVHLGLSFWGIVFIGCGVYTDILVSKWEDVKSDDAKKINLPGFLCVFSTREKARRELRILKRLHPEANKLFKIVEFKSGIWVP